MSDQRDPQPLARDAASSIPYSPGLSVGDTIHVSGTIGRPPDGDLPADIAEQFRQLTAISRPFSAKRRRRGPTSSR